MSGADTLTVPLSAVQPHGTPLRSTFDDLALEGLVATIEQWGVLEPLLVRERAAGRYEVVAGMRRYEAARRAGVRVVPVRNLGVLDDASALEIALVENLQREDLNPLDEARTLRRLNKDVGLTQVEIARKVGRRQPDIAKIMGLLELPPAVQTMIGRGRLTRSHGVGLARFKDFPTICERIAGIAQVQGLTARDLSQGLPAAADLQRDWLVQRVDDRAAFNRATCAACSYQAFVPDPGSETYGWCLKPAHYKQLQADALAPRKAPAPPPMSAQETVAAPIDAADRPQETPAPPTVCVWEQTSSPVLCMVCAQPADEATVVQAHPVPVYPNVVAGSKIEALQLGVVLVSLCEDCVAREVVAAVGVNHPIFLRKPKGDRG